MLRPRTALRIVLYTAATWLVLGGLYVGLPSFSRDDDGIQYATQVLTSGRTLTRVYGVYDGFYVGGAAEFTNYNEPRTNIALTFRVDKASNSLFICGTNRLDLTRAPDTLHPDEIFSMEPVAAPAGDIEGVSLEWFDTADAVLMYHWIHGDKALVSLDVGYSEGGRQLNIWPAGASNREEKLLFSVTVNDTPESDVLIARVPRSPLSISPSPIYHVRLVLLIFVAPLTILLMGALMGLRFIISTVFSLLFRLFCIISGILLAAWLYEGRPPVKEYEEKVMNDLRGLVERVQHWRNVKNEGSSNRGKEDEQSSPSKDEESGLSLAGAAKDVT